MRSLLVISDTCDKVAECATQTPELAAPPAETATGSSGTSRGHRPHRWLCRRSQSAKERPLRRKKKPSALRPQPGSIPRERTDALEPVFGEREPARTASIDG